MTTTIDSICWWISTVDYMPFRVSWRIYTDTDSPIAGLNMNYCNDIFSSHSPKTRGMRSVPASWCPCFRQNALHSERRGCHIYNIQSGQKNNKKNATFTKSVFSYLYLSKYNILYIKLNAIGWTLWWWKLYHTIFYDKYFIHVLTQPSCTLFFVDTLQISI